MGRHRPGASYCVHVDPGCMCVVDGLPHVRGLCLLEHVPLGQDGEDDGGPWSMIWGQENMAR